jgi:hypothetical protein
VCKTEERNVLTELSELFKQSTSEFKVVPSRIQKPFWQRKPVFTGFTENHKTRKKTVGLWFKTQILNFMNKNWLADQFDRLASRFQFKIEIPEFDE